MSLKSNEKKIIDNFFKPKENKKEYKYDPKEAKEIVTELFNDPHCKALLEYLADK